MKPSELIELLKGGALNKYRHLYSGIEEHTERYIKAINEFCKLYGTQRDICLFSVPGRSEISGNHTDHNHGCVLAGAIDRDIIAVAAKSDKNTVRIQSEGHVEGVVDLSLASKSDCFKKQTSRALIAGVCAGFMNKGYEVGGFDAYTTSQVLRGSGLSSSAAFEVMVGNILNHLFNNSKIPNTEIAKIAQYSENEYYGKPCGLMDQMACAVGGFVYIDFLDPKNPTVEPINFSLSDAGYSLCIINTHGRHSDLASDYAAVPAEMKSVASFFGRDVLRGITEEQIVQNSPVLRRASGDRAVLRALHFVRENERVEKQVKCLKSNDINGFISLVKESGNSSFRYLQNVYSPTNPAEQSISLALCLTEGVLCGERCAWRVHGGGFAGTVQAFVPDEYKQQYATFMDSIYGDGSCIIMSIRPDGAIKIEL